MDRLRPHLLLLAVLTALSLLAAACTVDGPAEEDQDTVGPAEPEDATAGSSGGDGPVGGIVGVADLVEEVAPSVVAITVTGGPAPGLLPGDPPSDEPPGSEGIQEPGPRGEGQGSGIVWGDDLVVTNAHVITFAEDVAVTLADGSRVDAEVLASDERTDVAVLRVDHEAALPVATFTEDLPRVGDVAVAIGSPLGLENTVTSGVVSGLDRAIPGAAQAGIPALTGLVQTDAALSPGSSGGALVDGDGSVIGMNVAFIPPQMQAVSIGFAIPSAVVVDVAEQLLEEGEVRHAFLGVQLAPLTGPVRDRLGLDTEEGALVLGVGEGSPAQEAGIEGGDVIVSLEDTEIRDLADLTATLRAFTPGDEVTLTLVRDGEERTVTATLSERPADPGAVDPGDLPDDLQAPAPGTPPPPGDPGHPEDEVESS